MSNFCKCRYIIYNKYSTLTCSNYDYHDCSCDLEIDNVMKRCLSNQHKCLCREFRIFDPDIECKSLEHNCICVWLSSYRLSHYVKYIDLINWKCFSEKHECICLKNFNGLCKADNHNCQCMEKPNIKNYKQPCSKKGFIINHHECLCGIRPICFAKKHHCMCKYVKYINLCIRDKEQFKQNNNGQLKLSVGFVKFCRKNNIRFECENIKELKHFFRLCVRKTYLHNFPNELIDYIFDCFINCSDIIKCSDS
jgi:hypothetical protein